MALRNRPPLSKTHPELAAEWDYEKNGDITPEQIHANACKEYWWKCSNGHSFKRSPYRRINGKQGTDYIRCRYCSRSIPTPGEYSLYTEFPDLVESEWDFAKNEELGLDPDNMLPGTSKKVHWKCSQCQNEWTASPKARTAEKRGCPECAKKKRRGTPNKFISGVNDIATLSPHLVSEWSDKNYKSPNEIHNGSAKDAWWKCPICGYEWKTRINHRTKDGSKCPVCTGKIASSKTSLKALYPKIAAEWDYDTNDKMLDGQGPEYFRPGSSQSVSWQCQKDPSHRYMMRINHKVEGFGCPYCSHHEIIPGNNTLAAEYPDLLEEWMRDKNDVNPDAIAPQANILVWWKCKNCGREWQAAVSDRVRRRSKCLVCCKGMGTSYAEQLVFQAVNELFPELEVIERYRSEDNVEIDVYIPAIGIGIEPGHWDFHGSDRDIEKDARKIKYFADRGIRIYEIYEGFPDGEDFPFDKDCYGYQGSFNIRYDSYLVMRNILRDIFSEYNVPEEIWNDEKWKEISANARKKLMTLSIENERTLSQAAPEFVEQWSPNNLLTPNDVLARSSQEALWVCEKGHEYLMQVKMKTSGRGCPICANKIILPEYNSISALYPDFVQYLSENNDLSPDEIFPGTKTVKMLWVCPECGETFEMTPRAMFSNSATVCPCCNKKTFEHVRLQDLSY